jgi:hypothetical protein
LNPTLSLLYVPDGTVLPTPNPSDRDKLQNAVNELKRKMENYIQNEKSVAASVVEARARFQQLQSVAKTAQKNVSMVVNGVRHKRAMITGSVTGRGSNVNMYETSENRVRTVIAALRKAADKRGDELIQRKSSSVNSQWIQSFPELPTALKKSLWHKMHRRKQQIILRPAAETFVDELRLAVLDGAKSAGTATSPEKQSDVDEALVRAEQIFLLAMHPVAKEGALPSVPPKNSDDWAEPGCHVILEVPEQCLPSGSILPCRSTFPILEKNLSEIASAPGRQAASLLRPSHFQCLSLPLSAVAVASSFAENCATKTQRSKYICCSKVRYVTRF